MTKKSSSDGLLPPESKQRRLVVKLTFPEAALRSIDLTGKWNGKVTAAVTGPTSARLTKIAHLREANIVRRRAPSPDVMWLIRQWNRHVDSPPYNSGDRNREFEAKKVDVCRGQIESLVDWYEQKELERMLVRYFEQCALGKHYWKDVDHRYKTLSGWVKAVVKAHATNGRCWWEQDEEPKKVLIKGSDYILKDDPYPETTAMVADAYAQLRLDRTEYGEPDKNWIKFQLAAKKVELAYEKGDIPARRRVFVKAVIRAAIKQNEELGRLVYPGNLTADVLWQIILPQFLADHLPGVRLPRF